MKKPIVWIGTLLVIIIFVGGAFVIQKNFTNHASDQNSLDARTSFEASGSASSASGVATTSDAASSISSTRVTALEQNVFHTETGKKDEEQIKKTASTTAGDIVRTSSTGRALIEAPKAHPAILDYNSQLTIVASQDEGNKTTLELLGGELWSRTKKSAEKGEFYQIKTGNAVAVVRGTSFGLSYSKNKTVLLVATGTVSIFNKDPSTGELLVDTEAVVTAGKKAIVLGNNPPVVTFLTYDDKNTAWFKYNTEVSGAVGGISRDTSGASTAPTSQSSLVHTTLSSSTTPSSSTPPPSSSRPVTGSGGGVVTGGTGGRPTSISPKSIQAGDNQTFVILRGSGFLNIQDLTVAENIPPDFEVIDDNTLRFHIGTLPSGTYDISFFMKDSSSIDFPQQLVITAGATTQRLNSAY